jgi:hypothetical protein
MSWLSALKACEISETPNCTTAKTDKKVPEVGSVSFVSSPPGPFSKITDPDTPRRLWLIAMPTGEVFSSSFFPSATREEVQAWYPTAKIEPEEEGPTTTAPVVQVDPPTVRQAPAPLVACGGCGHYQANARGWGGLGSCRASAPASRQPGSLWPNSKIRCNVYAPIEGTRNV